jgi:hypothetical protein
MLPDAGTVGVIPYALPSARACVFTAIDLDLKQFVARRLSRIGGAIDFL